MNDEVKGYNSAEVASASHSFLEDEHGKTDFNLQLRYWVEALDIFKNIEKDKFRLEEALSIINKLCNSLETLAGVNISPQAKTPSLIKLYSETLKTNKGWDLSIDKPKLYGILKEMDEVYKNVTKHLNKSESRKELLKRINYKKLYEYVDAAREIWLWFLGKYFKNNIPNDQLVYFKKDY